MFDRFVDLRARSNYWLYQVLIFISHSIEHGYDQGFVLYFLVLFFFFFTHCEGLDAVVETAYCAEPLCLRLECSCSLS